MALKTKATFIAVMLSVLCGASLPSVSSAQERLPQEVTLANYHRAPAYRESESHPLRIIAYVVHPIGYALRELIFRPFSYFASSTEETRALMGYRAPYDYRQPACFHNAEEVPDCRRLLPVRGAFPGLSGGEGSESGERPGTGKAIYFSDVNFDFNKRQLNSLGKSKARTVASTIKDHGSVKVVLQGHADSRGSEEYNKKLGMDRAEAVRQELVTLGVAAERLSTVSFGETKPLFTEKEEWAYAANRRVEVHMQEGEASTDASKTVEPEGDKAE
jgi:outer membrane protein OmpA-like peptidoglycan-associated protein